MIPDFDVQQYPYPSRREVIFARKGMVCTSQTLAAQAGLSMLKRAAMPLMRRWPLLWP